jgi:hypothetical protein
MLLPPSGWSGLKVKAAFALTLEYSLPSFAKSVIKDRGRRNERGASFVAQASGGLQLYFDLVWSGYGRIGPIKRTISESRGGPHCQCRSNA